MRASTTPATASTNVTANHFSGGPAVANVPVAGRLAEGVLAARLSRPRLCLRLIRPRVKAGGKAATALSAAPPLGRPAATGGGVGPLGRFGGPKSLKSKGFG